MATKETIFKLDDALGAKVSRLKRNVSNEEPQITPETNVNARPCTQIGKDALRDFNIDLDSINFAFNKAMKRNS